MVVVDVAVDSVVFVVVTVVAVVVVCVSENMVAVVVVESVQVLSVAGHAMRHACCLSSLLCLWAW